MTNWSVWLTSHGKRGARTPACRVRTLANALPVVTLVLTSTLTAAPNDTRLADAAMRGDKEAIRSLLKQGVPINTAQGDGATALHWAAYNQDLDTLKLLLAAGASVKSTTREGGITPLLMACVNGDALMIEALLKAGSNANSTKSNGTTALMIASASGSTAAVKALLDHKAGVNAKESAHGQTALMFAAALNRTDVIKLLAARGAALNIATPVRKLERVRFDQDGNIVEDRPAPAKPAAAGPDPKAEETARGELDALARSMGLQSTEYRPNAASRTAKPGDVAARGPRKIGADFLGGMTALLYAAREGHMDAARALAEAGADLNQSNGDKVTPLVMAIMNGHYALGKLLLDRGADPNLATSSGLTALYATVDVQWAPKTWYPQPDIGQEKVTYLDLMKALLDHGANVNTAITEKLWFRSYTNDYTWVDPAAATPFWRAAQSSDVAAMRLLVEHGADAKAKSKSGVTPLMAAAGIGWAANWSVNAPYPAIEAVKYCVELGNDVNAADGLGYTALHGAAYLGNNEMVNYLVSKGAKVDVKSKAGDSVADMANGPTRFGLPHPETVALLEKLGSPNSHNCRSDQCVVAAKSQIYDRRTPADYTAIAQLEAFAKAIGFTGVEYRVDAGAAATARTGGH